jgi:hypothetical protein
MYNRIKRCIYSIFLIDNDVAIAATTTEALVALDISPVQMSTLSIPLLTEGGIF